MRHLSPIESFFRAGLALGLALAWVACAAPAARAGLVLGVASGTATPGSSTNSFDVTLSNSGPSDVEIAGFQFAITASSGDVSFRDVNISTVSAPYIFAGNSIFGPDIITSVPGGNSVSAEDNFSTPHAGATLMVGQTLDLGHVVFALSLNAPQTPIPLTFSPTDTSVNDQNGNNLSVTIPASGALTIRVGAAVPEPVSLLLGLQGMLLTGYVLRRRRRGARP
jgi:hypothetical protein